MVFHLVVFVVAAMALVAGFRKGFARQVPSLVGLAFGIVSAHLLWQPVSDFLTEAFPRWHGETGTVFIYGGTARALVFLAIYFLFTALLGFMGQVLHRRDHTVLDNLGGALLMLLKGMLMLSILYNLLAALNPASSLVKSARSDDGNASVEVMLLAPALLGGETVEDFALRLQLEDAKKIS